MFKGSPVGYSRLHRLAGTASADTFPGWNSHSRSSTLTFPCLQGHHLCWGSISSAKRFSSGGGGGGGGGAATANRAWFKEATKDIPKTPDGNNPYDVFGFVPTENTGLDEMAKMFKKLAVQNHPDREGGSHDKMAELNAAFGIIKKHHEIVLKNMVQHRENAMKNVSGRQGPGRGRAAVNKTTKLQEDLGRSGGLRQNVRAVNAKKARTAADIDAAWEEFKDDREEMSEKIIGRFEVACEQINFFAKYTFLTEIVAREKWMRTKFIRGMWEDVHELRSELLRKGARNSSMSSLAEEMVSFAKSLEDKLNEDLRIQADKAVTKGMQVKGRQMTNIFVGCFLVFNFFYLMVISAFYNQMSYQLGDTFKGTSL